MSKLVLKVGQIVEIPLSSGKKAYGQYVFADKKMGPLLQVYDLITENNVQLDLLKKAHPLFPPLIVGLKAALRLGIWNIVDWIPVENFVYPNFVTTLFDQKEGKARVWFLWDGERDIRIGDELPEKYKNLEFLMVWSPFDVVKRIETGEYPFPYRELIQNNKYTPRK